MRSMGWALLAIAALVDAPTLPAGGGVGGGGGGGGQRPPGMSDGQGSGSGARQPRGGRATERAEDQVQDRERMRSTDQQREQIRTCDRSADRVRAQAREMERSCKGRGFDPTQARRQRDQIRDQVRLLQQEHERFAQGLSEAQRTMLQDRLRAMEQTRERLNLRLQEMDRELEGPGPDGERLAAQAREVRREMKEWQKEHRRIGSEMSAEP